MRNSIIDNERKTFLSVFNDITNSGEYKELAIATGYWDLKGTDLVIENLKKFNKVRLLIGREPLIPRHQLIIPESDYPDLDIFSDLEGLVPDEKLKQTIITIKELIDSGKLEVRVYKKTFLHAKCYIFGDYSSNNAIGIIGSSNFTANGLEKNTELNALESDNRIVTYRPSTKEQEVGHLFWFDQLWEDETTEAWEGKFKSLLEESPAGDILFSPYETYIKTLYELYKEELEEINLVESCDGKYELLDFQKRNVQHLLKKLNKYGTAMLCDSVGLGKTVTAIEVIKNYTDSDTGRKRVAVICPKSLKKQWETELTHSGLPNMKPIVLQNMQELEDAMSLDEISSVSLFVIDESHNLRKTTGKRYSVLLDWIKNNPKAHTLMLTATPINNELKDITNQILLGTRGEVDSIRITTIDSKTKMSSTKDFVKAIEDLQKRIKQQTNKNEPIDYEDIKSVMSPIIRSIVVRRTRHGIEQEYGCLKIDGKERKFPKSIPENYSYSLPQHLVGRIINVKSSLLELKSIYSKNPEDIIEKCTALKHPLEQISEIHDSISDEKLKNESPVFFIFQLILMLGFIPYRWRIYLTKYYGKTPEQISEMKLSSDESRDLQQQRGIYGIFRTIFLKRMESSVRAISISLERYKEKLKLFEQALEKGNIVGLKDVDLLKDVLDSTDEDGFSDESIDLLEEIILDTVDDKKYNVIALKEDIKRDLEIINIILKQLKFLEDEDTKLTALIDLLKKIDKDRKSDKKVLIFSYFADTVNYLEEKMEKLSNGLVNKVNAAFLSTKNRNESNTLAGRFSPKSKKYTIEDSEIELNYLFSTDILSEGQNLQDCGIIINYDLHWNPVRMIQRNGRINRLGSDFDTVYIYNMAPLQKLEAYLKLVKRLESKIGMINYTIGNDQSVLGETANPIDYIENIEDLYSDDEAKRIKAITELEKAGDFLLVEDDFILDLKKFDKNPDLERIYKNKIYNIPKGKWAIMPKTSKESDIQVLALANLYSEKAMLFPSFIGMNRNGLERTVISQLIVLQDLKTDISENTRKKDNISCNKKFLIEKINNPDNFIEEVSEEQAPRGQKLKILNIMKNIHYSANDMDLVRGSFYTTNYHDRKEIDRLVRIIVKAESEDKPYQNNLNLLVSKANEIKSKKKQVVKPNIVEPVLVYVRENI